MPGRNMFTFLAYYICKEAIEAAVREHYDGMYLSPDAAKSVLQTYGMERMAHVLANIVQLQDWDARYSSNNLNQLTRRVHETGRIYAADLEDISQRQEQLWAGGKGDTGPAGKALMTGTYIPSAEGGTAFFSQRLSPLFLFVRILAETMRLRIQLQ